MRGMTYSLTLVNHSNIIKCGCLSSDIQKRIDSTFVQYDILPKAQLKKTWLAGFTCCGGSMCKPSLSLVGSCHMIGDRTEEKILKFKKLFRMCCYWKINNLGNMETGTAFHHTDYFP